MNETYNFFLKFVKKKFSFTYVNQTTTIYPTAK